MKTAKRKQWNLTKYKELLKETNAAVRGDRKNKEVSSDEWYEASRKLIEDNPELPAFLISLGIKKDAEDKISDDIAHPSNTSAYKENRIVKGK